ncbi:MAG TPA: hypothetical protein VM537_30210 [Anaerolineae bacterium]|nr:hypothetical protein [Anaerolineae bacterium]
MFDFLSPLLALFVVVAIYLRQREESGLFGGVAFVVMFIGLALVVSLDYFGAFIRLQLPEVIAEQLMEGPSGTVVAVSALIFLLGEIMLGISVVRAGVFSKIAAVFFMIGLIPVPLAGVFPDSVVAIGSIAAGVGLIWWGTDLYRLAGSESERAIR